MKNLLLLLFIASIAITSCSRGPSVDMVKQAKTDDSIIRVYLSNNPLIKAVKDPSGLYYQVVKQGTGAYPNSNSMVTVNYQGKLINGAPFDSANGFSSSLDRLVKAWQIGIPHVREGGNILLFVPSALGYGPSGGGPIPGNAVLIFDIDLVSFK
jgi:FKBP-type peptidyl-prolyl cis-trans isomerase FkpA